MLFLVSYCRFEGYIIITKSLFLSDLEYTEDVWMILEPHDL